MEVSPQEIINAVKRMRKLGREAFLEDLLASTSPEYLESIKRLRTCLVPMSMVRFLP